MNISSILSKVSTLKFHPEWVDGGPGLPGPVFNTFLAEYVVAGIAKEIGQKLNNRDLSEKVTQTASELVAEVARQVPGKFNVADEWYDICPPYPPRPHSQGGPSPEPWFELSPIVAGPHPEPWLEASTLSMQEVALAIALRDLAAVTTIEKASATFKEVGEQIMKQASARLFDEYCGTPVKPRIPIPRPGQKKAA